jgi:hypothetical protein
LPPRAWKAASSMANGRVTFSASGTLGTITAPADTLQAEMEWPLRLAGSFPTGFPVGDKTTLATRCLCALLQDAWIIDYACVGCGAFA